MLTKQETDFGRYYSLLLRNKKLFFIPLLVVFPLVVLVGLVLPKVYESGTIIRVLSQQPNPIGTERLVEEDLEGQLKTLQDMILSRPHLMKTIRQLGLDADVEDDLGLERLINSLRLNISIRNRGSQLFMVAYQDTDPERAMHVTNSVVNLFIEESLSFNREGAFESVDFIQNQLAVYKGKLEASEEGLREFKQAHLGAMPDVQNANLVQLERTRDALAETSLALQEAISKKHFIERQLNSEQPMVVSLRSGEATTVEEKIRILEFQLSQLMANYTEKHPDIIKIRTELEQLRSEQSAGIVISPQNAPQSSGDLRTLNPLHQRLKEDYSEASISIGTLQARIRVLESKIAEYEQKALSIPNQEKELAALQRDYNVNEKIYQMLLMKLEEARISKQLEFSRAGARFQVVEPAVVPVKPIKPKLLHFLAGGLLLGCATGGGLIFLKDYFDTSVKGVHEAEEVYKLPVLATIPLITDIGKESGEKKKGRMKWILGSAVLLLLLAGAAVVSLFRDRLPLGG